MKIFVAIPHSFAGCGFYRQYQPHNRLAKMYPDAEITLGAGLYDENDQFCIDADIIHFHKGYFDLKGIEEARLKGIVTIADFDDWWKLDTEHLFYRQYIKNDTSQQLASLLTSVDYVTCSTELLANEVRKYNPNVIVLENAMDMEYDSCQGGRINEQETVFGYVGGHCHGKDVELLRGVNNRISQYANYKFRLMGYDGSEVYNHYAEVMSDGGKLAGTKFDWAEKSDIWNYHRFYNYMDVSLVPLVGNKFNSLKSELKLIEAGFFKRAVICSNVNPYIDILEHKVNAYVVNKPTDWVKGCKFFLNNPNAIKEFGEALHERVQPFHVDEVNKKRYKFYTDVLKERNTNSSERHSRLQVIHE